MTRMLCITSALAFKLAVFGLACGPVAGAQLDRVTLDNDLGCDTLQTQRERMSALKVAWVTSMAKAQGNTSPEMEALNRTATVRFTDLSRDRCRYLAGTFKVLERQPLVGGGIWRVKVTKTESLWVLIKDE